MNILTTSVGHKPRVFYKGSDGIIKYIVWNGSTWSKILELQLSIPKFGVTQITTIPSDNTSYPSPLGWKKVTVIGNNKGIVGIAVDGTEVNRINITNTASWSVSIYLILSQNQKVCAYTI